MASRLLRGALLDGLPLVGVQLEALALRTVRAVRPRVERDARAVGDEGDRVRRLREKATSCPAFGVWLASLLHAMRHALLCS